MTGPMGKTLERKAAEAERAAESNMPLWEVRMERPGTGEIHCFEVRAKDRRHAVVKTCRRIPFAQFVEEALGEPVTFRAERAR